MMFADDLTDPTLVIQKFQHGRPRLFELVGHQLATLNVTLETHGNWDC